MRKITYTFGNSFETTDYQLAEQIRTEKKIPYGVKLETVDDEPAWLTRKREKLGVVAE